MAFSPPHELEKRLQRCKQIVCNHKANESKRAVKVTGGAETLHRPCGNWGLGAELARKNELPKTTLKGTEMQFKPQDRLGECWKLPW